MKLWTQYGLGVVVWRTHAFTHTSSCHIPHHLSLCMIRSVTGESIVLVEFIFFGWRPFAIFKNRYANCLDWWGIFCLRFSNGDSLKIFSSRVHRVFTVSRGLRFLASFSLEESSHRLTGDMLEYNLVLSRHLSLPYHLIPDRVPPCFHSLAGPCRQISIMTRTMLV